MVNFISHIIGLTVLPVLLNIEHLSIMLFMSLSIQNYKNTSEIHNFFLHFQHFFLKFMRLTLGTLLI